MTGGEGNVSPCSTQSHVAPNLRSPETSSVHVWGKESYFTKKIFLMFSAVGREGGDSPPPSWVPLISGHVLLIGNPLWITAMVRAYLPRHKYSPLAFLQTICFFVGGYVEQAVARSLPGERPSERLCPQASLKIIVALLAGRQNSCASLQLHLHGEAFRFTVSMGGGTKSLKPAARLLW